MQRPTLLPGIALVVLVACNDEPEPVPSPTELEPKAIPDTLEIVASEEACLPLRDGETLRSVSPEGHAWLVVPGEPSSVRVLDPFGGTPSERIEDLELPDIEALRAWSGEDAAALTGEGVWRIEGFARVALTPPEGAGEPSAFCGSPSDNGVLVADGKVYELRADHQWWAWTPEVPAASAPTSFAAIEGECQSRDNATWLTADDGALYRVAPAQFSLQRSFVGLVGSVATNDHVFVADDDGFWVGPKEWQLWTSQSGEVSHLAAANGHAWLTIGKRVLRSDGAEFGELEHSLAAIDGMMAHAGGVWLSGEGRVCHHAIGPMLRVSGVRPNQRQVSGDVAIDIASSDASATLGLTVDGEPRELTAESELGVAHVAFELETVGWHDVTITSDGDAGFGQRQLMVKRVPEVERGWAKDIEPIASATCALSGCHATGSKEVDLSSVDGWLAMSTEIREQVVDTGAMPQVKPADWGDEQVEIIAQWLEGGMLP